MGPPRLPAPVPRVGGEKKGTMGASGVGGQAQGAAHPPSPPRAWPMGRRRVFLLGQPLPPFATGETPGPEGFFILSAVPLLDILQQCETSVKLETV